MEAHHPLQPDFESISIKKTVTDFFPPDFAPQTCLKILRSKVQWPKLQWAKVRWACVQWAKKSGG